MLQSGVVPSGVQLNTEQVYARAAPLSCSTSKYMQYIAVGTGTLRGRAVCFDRLRDHFGRVIMTVDERRCLGRLPKVAACLAS